MNDKLIPLMKAEPELAIYVMSCERYIEELASALRGLLDMVKTHKEIYGYEKQHWIIDGEHSREYAKQFSAAYKALHEAGA